jgi:hypothetical protein
MSRGWTTCKGPVRLAKLAADGQIQQILAFLVGVGHGLLAPDMSVCEQGLSVQPAVFLHVGQVHEQIERRPGQHLIDVWIVMRHAILCGALLRARADDVAHAHELDVRRLGQMGQVL